MYTVTCESTADLPYEYLRARNCKVIFYTYTIGEEEFEDNMGRDSGALAQFYELVKTKRALTSQICTESYENFFREQLKYGDVLHISFSNGLSQSVRNAMLAAETVNKEGDHKVVVVDSLCGGGGYGLFVDGVLDERDKGASFEELCNWATENRTKTHLLFFSTDLTFFRRSGRVSAPIMMIGNLLRICPLMRVTKEGKIVVYSQVISAKKAITKIMDDMEKLATGGKEHCGKVIIQHSNCWHLAQQTKAAMDARFPNLHNVEIHDIGMVMASHCGPGTIAVYFWGDQRNY
ncbi:MAG: DegV family protein [Corallococcus sp.]|nr:DegV family protein [Corallococcus sp.]MCM1359940.1 DegV family protein [Corallococcus sp.]MCM1395496.1 DegV family protein [Corallococcus sp.]